MGYPQKTGGKLWITVDNSLFFGVINRRVSVWVFQGRGYSISSTGFPTLRGEVKPSPTCRYALSPQEMALVITNTYIKKI
jgi:hypothetical protein